MDRRLRTTAGILALLSLTLSVAESVWASTCAPGMRMEAPAAVVPSSGDHGPGCPHVSAAHDDMDEGRHTSDEGRHTSDEGRHTADEGRHTSDEGRHTSDEGRYTSDDGRHADDDGQPCPFSSLAAAQACTGVASLPARPMTIFASWSQGAPGVFSLETQNDLLFETALFRPPRA